MKRLIPLLLSLFFIQQVQAQNWRPFDSGENTRHYLAEDSCIKEVTFFPILSTVIDTTFQTNGRNTYVFMKGFSYLKAVNLWQTTSGVFNYYQKVKGKILGDTAVFYADSSIITSVDTFGFRLNFPTHYRSAQSWELGKSIKQSIQATVDSIYFDSIPQIGYDSMVSIRLQLKDSLGNAVTNSSFNQTITLSKTHGLIHTIDFTDLDRAYLYNLFPWISQRKTHYIQNEYHTLSTGDYYYSSTHTGWGTYNLYKYTVISDTTVNFDRTLVIERQKSRDTTLPWFIVNPFTFQLQSTQTFTHQIKTDSLFRLKQSGIVPDSFFNPSNNYYDLPQFGMTKQWGQKWMIELTDANIVMPSNSWWPFFIVDSIQVYTFEYTGSDFPLVGVGNQEWHRSNQTGISYRTESIFFLKKGNQTWGTQPLVVGLEENQAEANFKVFPNPASNTISLSSELNLRQIHIYDQRGNKVISLSNPKNQINVSELSDGIYFLKVMTEEGELINQKFIKQ